MMSDLNMSSQTASDLVYALLFEYNFSKKLRKSKFYENALIFFNLGICCQTPNLGIWCLGFLALFVICGTVLENVSNSKNFNAFKIIEILKKNFVF